MLRDVGGVEVCWRMSVNSVGGWSYRRASSAWEIRVVVSCVRVPRSPGTLCPVSGPHGLWAEGSWCVSMLVLRATRVCRRVSIVGERRDAV